MSPIPHHIVPVTWSTHEQALRRIRQRVFVAELGVPEEQEWDGEDIHAEHFLALNEAGLELGCARLHADGRISRVGVLAEYRGQHVGRDLVSACHQSAVELGLKTVRLNTPVQVEAFYRALGYLPVGAPYDAFGSQHQAMEYVLPLDFPGTLTVTTHPPERPQAAVPTTPPAHQFDNHADASVALLNTLQRANRRVCIFSPYLDHDLFDTEAVAQAVSAIARAYARAEIRMLILSSKLIVSRGHRLLDLARRLDDKISIRWLDEAPNAETSSFVCVDTDTYWLLPSFEHPLGIAEIYNPVTTKRLQETFDTAWARSKLDPELRQLRI